MPEIYFPVCVLPTFCKWTIGEDTAGPSIFRWLKNSHFIFKLLINTWENMWGGDSVLFSKHSLEQLSFGVSIPTLTGSCVAPGTTGKHRRSVLLALWIILPTVKPRNLTESFICKERADVQSLPAWVTLWRGNVQYELQVSHHLQVHTHT